LKSPNFFYIALAAVFFLAAIMNDEQGDISEDKLRDGRYFLQMDA
jgi:hypothetical protein